MAPLPVTQMNKTERKSEIFVVILSHIRSNTEWTWCSVKFTPHIILPQNLTTASN